MLVNLQILRQLFEIFLNLQIQKRKATIIRGNTVFVFFLINYKHLNFEGLYQVYQQACQDFFHLHLDVSRSFIFFIGVPLTSNNSKQNKWQLELKWPLLVGWPRL